MTKLDLYRYITQPFGVKTASENESMAYGSKMEPLIRKMFSEDFKDTYKTYAPKNFEMYRRIDKPYLTATLDGRLVERKRGGAKGILEIKTHDIRNAADAALWKNGLPENYYIQVIHYLMVMNDYQFVVLVGKLRYFDYFHENGKKLIRTDFVYHYIDRKEVSDQIVKLEKAETDFWENNIVKRIPPTFKLKIMEEIENV